MRKILLIFLLIIGSISIIRGGLSSKVYAGHSCPASALFTFCGGDGNVWRDTCSAQNVAGHIKVQDCSNGCENGTCKSASQPQNPNGIGSAADGPGGCCDPGVAVNAANGCRSLNEVCDIANGGCASNRSCRSTSGCGINSDCGPGNRCDGGTCRPGSPSGQCQSASSLDIRFQIPGSAWASSLSVAAGRQVNVGIFRNGTDALAGTPVNTIPIRDTITASISGPNFSQGLSTTGSNSITPTQAGIYTGQASCGNNVTGRGSLTVTAGRADTGGPATACNGNVASQGNESRYASWNGQCTGAVQTSQSGGIGQGCCEVGCGADAQCDEQTAGQGNCNASCKVTTNQTTTTIGGTVRDEQGRGVRGVKVWVNDPTSSIGYRGGMFKVTTTKDDGTYSVDVSRANYFVRIPGESAAGLSGRTDGEDNLKIFQAGSVSQSYESQPAGAGCADKCDFTVTLLHSSPDPTAPPTDPPVVYPTKVRIANSEVGLVVSQRILDFSGQYTPSNPLAVDWILEDLSGQPQKVYIQFGFGTGTNVQWDSRVYSSDNITYTFESGSCECGATNLCASSCQFTKLASGITYTNPIRCSYNDTDPSITFPTAANKNSWCNRNKRTLGDANGDNIINAVDYTYYLRGVLNGKIPPGVNPDFNGNGDIDRNDLMIWTQGEGQ